MTGGAPTVLKERESGNSAKRLCRRRFSGEETSAITGEEGNGTSSTRRSRMYPKHKLGWSDGVAVILSRDGGGGASRARRFRRQSGELLSPSCSGGYYGLRGGSGLS
jgi:hypothetical protein